MAYKNGPPQLIDTEIDDLSSVVPGGVEWTFAISNKELRFRSFPEDGEISKSFHFLIFYIVENLRGSRSSS